MTFVSFWLFSQATYMKVECVAETVCTSTRLDYMVLQ